jgi:hemerythrin-like domain-containing protein
MPGDPHPESLAVMEMKLIHDIHRAATALLTKSAARPGAPAEQLDELRQFVVAALRHHHESEDDALWPMLQSADPGAAGGLRDMTREHHDLDAAITILGSAPIGARKGRTGLAAPAAEVQDLVGHHLAHEESLTFPVLRLLPPEQWAGFSRAAIESAPATGAHLQMAFMEEVGAPSSVAAVLAGLPAPAAQALPALRAQGLATLQALRDGQEAS